MLPFLQSKISIPPARQNRVERLRLVDRIHGGMKRVLTLIVAPAGFGKTTLMAEWARTAPMPVAWLSLEQADQAPDRFLAYVIHSLQQVRPQSGQTALAMLRSGQLVNEEAVVFSLVNDLGEIPADFALILDDYHAVEQAQVNAILQFILEHCPAHLHIGVTSRITPGFSLARLRARDQVVEIDAADLRFTEPEIHEFLEQMGAPLPPEQLSHLNRSTEGWAVGLQLAGLSLARQPFDWNIPAGQAHIFDYLAEEVLRRENPEVRNFLQVSALFDRFSRPLMDTLLQGADQTLSRSSAEILAYIERANLFLVPLDSSGTWFRYHALFAEFLRRQLPAGQVNLYCRAASLWFDESGLLDEAIHYAAQAADFERAAALLETHYVAMVKRGRQSTLMEWLGSLPPEVMASRPRLWLAKGWAAAILLDSVQVEACVEKVEALTPADGTGDSLRLRGEAKALRTLSEIFAGRAASGEDIPEAFIQLSEQDEFLHSLLHFNLGMRHILLGNTAQALDAFGETLRLTQTLDNPIVTIIAHVQIGETRQIRGALGLAERAFQSAIQYARETLGENSFLLGMPYVSYADLLREQNRFEEALRYASQGIALCQVWQPIASMDGQIALARMFAAQGRWDEAFDQLEHARRATETSVSIIDDTIVALQSVRLTLLQGDLVQAGRLIKTHDLENFSERTFFTFREMTQLVLLRAKTAALQSDPEPAPAVLEALSGLIAESERRGRVTPVLEACILKARVHHALADHAAAADCLSHALALGAQSGYVRIFADEGMPLLHLLEQYRAKLHAPHAYIEEITNLLRREQTDSAAGSAPPMTRDRQSLTPLTRRELDILQLLAAGKSNQEIAGERVLTLNTVKKHVANILLKLGVANRTQAVMLAKKEGWLE